MKKLNLATQFLEEYWSKVKAGAFETMPMKMPARVKSSRHQLQALIEEISKTEDTGAADKEGDNEDGYCYDWSLLQERLAENMEAEFLEEPYEALEQQLKDAPDALKSLKSIAEQQWKD